MHVTEQSMTVLSARAVTCRGWCKAASTCDMGCQVVSCRPAGSAVSRPRDQCMLLECAVGEAGTHKCPRVVEPQQTHARAAICASWQNSIGGCDSVCQHHVSSTISSPATFVCMCVCAASTITGDPYHCFVPEEGPHTKPATSRQLQG